MSPEYLNRGIITKELDIFSLGVIIIEITTGDKHYPYKVEASSQEFIELVLTNWKNRLEKVQEYTSQEFDCQQIRRCVEIGLLCVKFDRAERPTTRQIIEMLAWGGAECSNKREEGLTHLCSTSNVHHLCSTSNNVHRHTRPPFRVLHFPCQPSKVDIALECARLQHRLSLPPLKVEDLPQDVSLDDVSNPNEVDILQEFLSVASSYPAEMWPDVPAQAAPAPTTSTSYPPSLSSG